MELTLRPPQGPGRRLHHRIVVVVASAAAAFAISNMPTKTYTAEARLVVTAGLGTDAAARTTS